MNFIPSKKIFNENNIMKDIALFSRKIKLRAHFGDTETRETDIEKKFYKTNKNWEPKHIHHTVSTFLEAFKRDATRALEEAKPHPSRNLTRKEEDALNKLMSRTDIIICKADKGGATVIMDVNDYIDEANRQLTDDKFYRKLDVDPTKTHTGLVNSAIDTLQRREYLKDKLAEGLKVSEVRTPLFYLLPKIHKVGNPGRPVVSSIQSHTSKISEFVDYHLQPIVQQTSSYVKDTNDFITKLETCADSIDDKTILVTMDVKSLYTNIPNEEGIGAVREFLSKAGKSLLIPVIVKFLWLILTLNNFIFNGKHYLQTNGVSMRTKCAPSYANIFMAYFEEKFIYPRIKNKSLLYLRYIDDIFILWKGTILELEQFTSDINSLHSTIKFEINHSKTTINFLDTTVTINQDKTIKTSLYEKPTDRHNFLHHKSYHPSSTKKSLPYSQALRIKKICSTKEDYSASIESMKEQFKRRGYVDNEIDEAIYKASQKDRNELLRPVSKQERKIPLTFVTTFNKSLPKFKAILENNWTLLGINDKISQKFEDKPMICYKRNPNLKQLIGSYKIENGKVMKRGIKTIGKCTPCFSKLGNKCCKQIKSTSTFKNRFSGKEYKILHRVNCHDRYVIYLLECRKCAGKAYVGKTEIPMNHRMNGHRSDARRTDKLAVDTHFLEPDHNFERDAVFTIIEKISKSDLTKSQMTNLLQRREDFWILKLGTLADKGFNIELNFPK